MFIDPFPQDGLSRKIKKNHGLQSIPLNFQHKPFYTLIELNTHTCFSKPYSLVPMQLFSFVPVTIICQNQTSSVLSTWTISHYNRKKKEYLSLSWPGSWDEKVYVTKSAICCMNQMRLLLYIPLRLLVMGFESQIMPNLEYSYL